MLSEKALDLPMVFCLAFSPFGFFLQSVVVFPWTRAAHESSGWREAYNLKNLTTHRSLGWLECGVVMCEHKVVVSVGKPLFPAQSLLLLLPPSLILLLTGVVCCCENGRKGLTEIYAKLSVMRNTQALSVGIRWAEVWSWRMWINGEEAGILAWKLWENVEKNLQADRCEGWKNIQFISA